MEFAARTAAVFPGQGSQAPLMGAPWRDHPVWRLVERAEELLRRPLAPLLCEAEHSPTNTPDVQLVVFLTSLMAWETARPVLGPPAVFAGHSLGQITALTAAGVLEFDDAVRVVARRGEVTDEACRDQPGGMVAVLGLSRPDVAWACSAAAGDCWLANDNAPGQVIVAGTEDALRKVEARSRELGARKILRLAVAGAFHTPLMLRAARMFAGYLAGVRFSPSATPVMSNAHARPIRSGSIWAALLAEHLLLPVLWRDSQEYLVAQGIDTFVEFGQGTTLTSIARRTVPSVEVWNVDQPAALDALVDGGGPSGHDLEMPVPDRAPIVAAKAGV